MEEPHSQCSNKNRFLIKIVKIVFILWGLRWLKWKWFIKNSKISGEIIIKMGNTAEISEMKKQSITIRK